MSGKSRPPPSRRTMKKRTKRARSMKNAHKKQEVFQPEGEIFQDLLQVQEEIVTDRSTEVEVPSVSSPQKDYSVGNIEDQQPTCSRYLNNSPQNETWLAGKLQEISPSEKEEYNFFDSTLLDDVAEIDAHELDIEVVNDSRVLNGNRIVDIDYFLKTCLRLQVDHNKRCTGGRLEIMKEKNTGLRSTFIVKCNMCEKEIEISNEDPNKQKSALNAAAVWGTLSTGSTYTHMLEFLSVLDIPAMSKKLFFKIQRELGQVWEESLWNILKEAGEEERAYALNQGNVDSNGIPIITVYLDGGWSKRSYGHTYNAASGVAVIIGKQSGKLLFIGVRNKYCSICARSENKGDIPKTHLCFKNWNSSSTAMEQDIIVEGFNNSIEMHGIKYSKFIADGDSSVYAKIKEKVHYGQEVMKVECMNHVLKNYSKSLYNLKKDTKGVSLDARKLLSKNVIEELVSAVQSAVYANTQDTENLKSDIRNTMYHVFGNHFSCKQYLCSKVGDLSEDRTAAVAQSGLHHHVYGAMNQLITKAHLLLDKETNNRAELFMSLLARFNMGKRLNLIQRDSFQIRSHLTGLKYNEGHLWHRKPWKKVFDESPGLYMNKFMTEQERCVQLKRDNPYRKPEQVMKKLKFDEKDSKDLNYAPNMAHVDLPEADLEKEVEKLCERLQITAEEQPEIEKKTLGQFDNPQYVTQRMHRLTASNFGAVIRRKPQTSCDVLVKKILSPKSFVTPGMAYGKANEAVALSIFSEQIGKPIRAAGLFVDIRDGFLGASPDGIINNEEIVEVKCSQKVAYSGKTIQQAVEEKQVQFLCLEDGKPVRKKTHDYYYQIQGQLSITNAERCHFIVYTGEKNALFHEVIEKDDNLWENIMRPKLRQFFHHCLAPEIILNRRNKNLRCRDPYYILKAQEGRNESSSEVNDQLSQTVSDSKKN